MMVEEVVEVRIMVGVVVDVVEERDELGRNFGWRWWMKEEELVVDGGI